MSHIDDAKVEAYLDGAYEALTLEDLAEIERRIEDDPAFAARVAEARAVRDQAAAILSMASPEDVDLPSFQELQRRAARGSGNGEGRRRWLGLPPVVGLSWAATVVLALGVGWSVGQGAGSPGSAVQAPASFPVREAAPPAETEDLTARADQTLVSGAREADEVADEAAQPSAGPPTVDEIGEAARRREDAPAATPDVETTAPGEPARTPDDAALRDRTIEANEKSAVAALERREGPEAFRPNQATQPAGAARAMEAPTFGLSGDHALHSLALPGLEVVGVNLDDTGTLAGVEILHRLPTGDTLSLRYVGLFSQADDPLRLGADERAEEEALPSVSAQIQGAALPAGWRQVVVRKENRWLIARAPLSEAEIRAYLMTLN